MHPDEREENAKVAKRLFFAGCFGLPWLWIVMAWYFWPEAKRRDAHPALRRYVNLAAAGGFIMTIGLVVWVIIFQTSWKDWGRTATDMMVVVPDEDLSGW
mmetsp:Transcript_4534/g.8655  ORF Transcript_4534/g.8655 Transcript_4534/m.8655 type:complete len:100 (-) Transcript_4534:8-307(-)